MTEPVSPLPAGLSAEELALLAEWAAEPAGTNAEIPAHPGLTTAPLSFTQERLWFLERLHAVGPTYSLPCAFRLRGPLRQAALEQALADVVARQAALRTVVGLNGTEPEQRIRPEMTVPWTRETLEHLPADDRETELRRRLRAMADTTFDLAGGPLVRAALFRLGAEDHVLLITLHHLVADEWSLAVLWRELAESYAARRVGDAPDRPPLDLQFGDVAIWQREQVARGAQAEQLDFWRGVLGRPVPALDLPTDRPRPPEMTYRGGQVALDLPPELFTAVRALGRQHGATTFAVLLTALFVLLRRLSGQADLTIGAPSAGRVRPEFEDLIGYFANTLVLRAKVPLDERFDALLARVWSTALDAFTNQDVPFERLVETLRPERDPSRNPLFQVMLAYQNVPQAGLALDELVVETVSVGHATAKFDLLLTLTERVDDATGWLEYNSDLFDASSAERLAECYLTLLTDIVASPEKTIGALELLTPARRRELVVDWNATATVWPEPDATLIDLLEAQARRTPDAPALGFEDRWLTYAELHRRAARLARHLQTLGVGPDVRVGICAERSLEMVMGLLGVLKAGGAYVPLDPGYPRERLAFMIADSQVPVLLTQTRIEPRLPETTARLVRLDGADAELDAPDDDAVPRAITPRNLAYMIYTSGSTGRPKGAMNQHDAIVNRLRWMQAEYALTPDDVVLQKTPFSFDVSVWEFFWPLLVGARLVMARPEGHKDPGYLIDTIARERVTTLHFVPSMLGHFLEAPGLSACESVRRVICSGEALPYDLQQRFFERMPAGATLHNLYGPTEAAVDVSFWACVNGDPRHVVPIGRPIANTQLYVLDTRMQPVPVGVAGELYIGGVQVGRGYLGRPDLTAERFVPDPFASRPGARLYRTGDLARHLPDGAIEYLGRLDHQIKLRGFRIELGEIEAALLAHRGVRDVVVVARADPGGAQHLVGYVVPAPTGSGDESALSGDLRRHLGERLPDHMVPGVFVFLDTLPLNPSGKVDRAALPAPTRARPQPGGTLVSPRSRLEAQIAAVWRDALGLDAVGVHDNFFELGGHSLLLLRVHARLQTELGTEVALMDLFRHTTIAALAEHLGQDAPAQTDATNVRDDALARAQRRRDAQQARRPMHTRSTQDSHP